MRPVTERELKQALLEKRGGEMLPMREIEISDVDVSGWDLSYVDFSLSMFHNVNMDRANLSHASIENALFDQCTFCNADLSYANMRGAALRYDDLSGVNIEGADLLMAVLEHAKLDGIIANDETKFFKLRCPEKGAFLGYKKCFNDRLVQLLIPADAKRSSATNSACRCSKAKVLTIKSFDYTESYEEAWSLVDENFVYRVGEWVEVPDYNEDRWFDSTTGIHFWMSREEAMAY